ncbi:hypothetical protein [Methanoculleus chikugoensis]|uniref:hypothetical protein n=1 Tax=Methanoculleus chikugoensis TaxID=118126 RepID=UPI000A8103FA|nr:hypothetical protein [Methanoculleus chikugoensis]
MAAARLIDCPSAVVEKRPGSEEDRGTYIVLGLSHDPPGTPPNSTSGSRAGGGRPATGYSERSAKNSPAGCRKSTEPAPDLSPPTGSRRAGSTSKTRPLWQGLGGWGGGATSSSSRATGRGFGSGRYGLTWTARMWNRRRETTPPAPAARTPAPAPARWTPSPPGDLAGRGAWHGWTPTGTPGGNGSTLPGLRTRLPRRRQRVDNPAGKILREPPRRA